MLILPDGYNYSTQVTDCPRAAQTENRGIHLPRRCSRYDPPPQKHSSHIARPLPEKPPRASQVSHLPGLGNSTYTHPGFASARVETLHCRRCHLA